MALAAEDWRQAHSLAKAPLSFEGPDGALLCAQQYVGVVQAGGVRVEIYPKLDDGLMRDGLLNEHRASTVMANLLWLLEESGYDGLVDAGEAAVEETPENISDLLAWLYARRLRHQLALGQPREYVGHRDDLPLVRGSIQFARQATVHFGRPDVIACAWDELTEDTPLARLLRCAAEALLTRVRLPGAAAALRDAVMLLEETPPAPSAQALAEAAHIRWSRLNARWRPCHDLALAVLRAQGRDLHAGGTESFVYLLDMNKVFESYCARWLEARFRVRVDTQVCVGTLLQRKPGGLRQEADFLWHDSAGSLWVGDAKYKLPGGENWPAIADTRQLICYGQLAALKQGTPPGALMLLFPTTDQENSEKTQTYDGQRLTLQPVRVVRSTAAPGMPLRCGQS